MKITAHLNNGQTIIFEKSEIVSAPIYWTLKQGEQTVLVAANLLVVEDDILEPLEVKEE